MKMVSNAIFALGILIFSTFASVDVAAADYSDNDWAFKRANLLGLAPYGPGYNERQRPVWARFIRMAAKYRDYDIARRIFDMRDHVDGAMSTQYAQDLLKLYRARPAFFVRAANRYFHGDYSMILAVWFDGTGEVSLIDLQGPAKRARRNRMVQRFMKEADSADQRMMSMN